MARYPKSCSKEPGIDPKMLKRNVPQVLDEHAKTLADAVQLATAAEGGPVKAEHAVKYVSAQVAQEARDIAAQLKRVLLRGGEVGDGRAIVNVAKGGAPLWYVKGDVRTQTVCELLAPHWQEGEDLMAILIRLLGQAPTPPESEPSVDFDEF